MNLRKMLGYVVMAVLMMAVLIGYHLTDTQPKGRFQTLVADDQTAYATLDREAKQLEVYFGDGQKSVDPASNPAGERFTLQNSSYIKELKAIQVGRTLKGTRVITLQLREDRGWCYADFVQGKDFCGFYADQKYSYRNSRVF